MKLDMWMANFPSNSNDRPDSDEHLLARFRKGDHDAATQLYLKYADRLQNLASSETSELLRTQVEPEDVVQSVFRTFFRRAAEGYFEVPPGSEIWNLFLVIALNKIRRSAKFHSRQKRDIRAKISIRNSDAQLADEDPTPATTLELTIDELLNAMDPLQRTIIEMRIQGYALEEISKSVRRSTRTVERVLKQFRDKLSRQIDGPE